MATSSASQFLVELAALCEKHRAELSYTNDDDGIHISIDGKEVFVGFLDAGDGPRQLRLAAEAI